MHTDPPERRAPPRPKSLNSGAQVAVRSPSGEWIEPDHLERLEELDDVIFAALDGDARALDRSAKLYQTTCRATPHELLEESREHYLRRAESIVQRYRNQPNQRLAQTFAALEILTLVAE